MWRAVKNHYGFSKTNPCLHLGRAGSFLPPSKVRERRNASAGGGIKVSEEKVMALRREDINVWERRAPIAPQHVKTLTQQGVKVLVQPSTRRGYTMQEYENAGAVITEDLSPASLIMAVKQVPIDILIPNKTYAFFSHTIKAQEGNMPLLDAMLSKNVSIVDYERMVGTQGQRVAAFGKFAGVAGMINVLHGLGLRLLALGHHTPFMYVGSTHNYKNSRQARLAIYELGEDIKAGKLPAHFGPLSFVFTGSGNVSQGAQEVFQELPHVYVHPHELKDALKKYDHRTIVATEVSRRDYLVPKAGGSFDAQEFEAHPERYRSIFAEKIAPYASVIVNGVYWAPKNPRLLTFDDALMLLEVKQKQDKYGGCPELPHRLLAICDISADLGGSIEFMKECTTIEYPFALYDIKTGNSQLGMAGDGVLMCSIDNLPAQLPREATDYFGKLLLPWIPEMLKFDSTTRFESQSEVSRVITDAIICSNGDLTPNYSYIAGLRASKERAKKLIEQAVKVDIKHKILLLGAGMVSHPFVEYLTRDASTSVTVVSALDDEVQDIAQRYDNTYPVMLDVEQSESGIETLVAENDLVVSLLPYGYHPTVAKMCIKHKRNMVTASYVLPAMRELDDDAKAAGITIMQEVGLDPGIDHLLAMECIDSAKDEHGKIISFVSYCGGLPSPEHSENPLRYKFSWSPKGALMTILNSARFLKNGQLVEIPSGKLLDHNRPLDDMFPGFHLEGYPNRDSLHYIDAYKLTDVETMMRGTIRYHGYSCVCKALLQLGLLNPEYHPAFDSNRQIPWNTCQEYFCRIGAVLRKLMNSVLGTSNLSESDLAIVVYDRIGRNDFALQGIQELGLLSEELIDPQRTPLDTMSKHLTKRLAYSPGERDIVLLRHQIGIQWPDMRKEQRDISLVAYGDPDGYSAMAKLVSLPTAIATRMLMDGEIVHKGNVVPLEKGIYMPLLKRLNSENIRWTTKTTYL